MLPHAKDYLLRTIIALLERRLILLERWLIKDIGLVLNHLAGLSLPTAGEEHGSYRRCLSVRNRGFKGHLSGTG